jgi:hypothetical protein
MRKKREMYEYSQVKVDKNEIYSLESDYYVITCHGIQIGNAVSSLNAARLVVNFLKGIDTKQFIEDRLLQIELARKDKINKNRLKDK